MRLIVLSIFTLAVLAIVLCSPIDSLTISYDLKCKSNDANSSMTHYSSLDEPTSRENENIIGYKARSFSYLEDGRINLDYIFAYNGKFNKSYGNSLVYNKMDMRFSGAKGLSELSADEFNPSNGAISSRKRVWYDGSGIFPKKPALGDSDHLLDINFNSTLYKCKGSPLWGNDSCFSGNINRGKFMKVSSEEIMGPGRNGSTNYAFDYDSMIENGTIDVTNTAKTASGSKLDRTDWVQSALMKGNITVRNDQIVSDL